MNGMKHRGARWVLLTGLVVALPALYVLSLGPCFYLAQHGWISVDTLVDLSNGPLEPVSRLYSSGGWLGETLQAWLAWWDD